MWLSEVCNSEIPRLNWLGRLSILFAVLVLNTMVQADGIPPSGVDLSKQVNVEASGFRLDRRTGKILQAIKVTNVSSTAINGQLFLLVEDMDDRININSEYGSSAISTDAGGNDHRIKLLPQDQTSLAPGESANIILRIDKPANLPVRYLPRVYVEAGGL